jgi:hypothetical protein
LQRLWPFLSQYRRLLTRSARLATHGRTTRNQAALYEPMMANSAATRPRSRRTESHDAHRPHELSLQAPAATEEAGEAYPVWELNGVAAGIASLHTEGVWRLSRERIAVMAASTAAGASAGCNDYEMQATWILRQNQQNQQLIILLLVKIGN